MLFFNVFTNTSQVRVALDMSTYRPSILPVIVTKGNDQVNGRW